MLSNLSAPSDNSSFSRDDSSALRFQFYAFGVVATIICALGLAGNLTSIRILMTHRMKTSTSIYLIALAMSDILILSCFLLAFSFPMLFQEQLENIFVPTAPTIKFCIYPLSLTAHTATVYVTVGFTVERYIAVCFPFESARWCSRPQARKAVALIVVFSVLYNLPRFFEDAVVTTCGQVALELCPNLGNASVVLPDPTHSLSLRDHPLYRRIYLNYLYVLIMFLLPFLFLIVMNGLLIRTVRKSGPDTQSVKEGQRRSRRRDTNLTVMLISVVAVFLICQAFALIDNILVVILPVELTQTTNYTIFYSVSQVMIVTNSAINFILYCCFGQKFRHAFLANCVCTFCKKRLIDVNGSTNIATLPSTRRTYTNQFTPANRGSISTSYHKGKPFIALQACKEDRSVVGSAPTEAVLRTTCL